MPIHHLLLYQQPKSLITLVLAYIVCREVNSALVANLCLVATFSLVALCIDLRAKQSK